MSFFRATFLWAGIYIATAILFVGLANVGHPGIGALVVLAVISFAILYIAHDARRAWKERQPRDVWRRVRREREEARRRSTSSKQ